MKRAATGRYQTSTVLGESVRAFIPHALPPDPAIQFGPDLAPRLERANLALGRLDGVSVTLPDTHLFLYTYVRKEAVLSSQIEGTQSSPSDLLLFELEESPGVPLDDAIEVSNYVAALDHGIARLRGGFPLSNRLIREVHEKLLSRGRGQGKSPGEFRRSQNWIGGTRPGSAHFVPPPPEHVEPCMGDLEQYLHDPAVRASTLLKAALAHVRLGGLARVLRHGCRGDRERRRHHGTGASRSGAGRSRAHTRRGQARELGPRVHEAMLERPLMTIATLVAASRLSAPTVTQVLAALESLGIVREITGRRRGRVYSYTNYMAVLGEGG